MGKPKSIALKPNQLVILLETWKVKNPYAYQLDGSLKRKSNGLVFCWVDFNGERFALKRDTTRKAVDRFLETVELRGDATLALSIGQTANFNACLRINDTNLPGPADGWFCYAGPKFGQGQAA